MKNAFVTLVGAGPGDPDLISLKGIRALAKADVVLYDALVHPALLTHAPDYAQKVYVGKRSGQHSYRQQDINALIVKKALQYGHVVRLKGGDPFIFGRGKEEIDHIDSFGIGHAIIPGISSINTPGLYGIPLTVRGINESFWVVTATTRRGALSREVALVSQSTATGVFLMGLGKISAIQRAYEENGKGWLPAAIVSKGSLEDNAVYFGTVNTLQEIKNNFQPEAPALIIVGSSIGTHEYFEQNVTNYNYGQF